MDPAESKLFSLWIIRQSSAIAVPPAEEPREAQLWREWWLVLGLRAEGGGRFMA